MYQIASKSARTLVILAVLTVASTAQAGWRPDSPERDDSFVRMLLHKLVHMFDDSVIGVPTGHP